MVALLQSIIAELICLNASFCIFNPVSLMCVSESSVDSKSALAYSSLVSNNYVKYYTFGG